MATDPRSRPDLLGFLQEQIKRREAFRQEIDRSIDILREAEQELRRILPGAEEPAETRDDLPYRLQAGGDASPAPSPQELRRRPPASRLRWEESAPPPAGGPASPLERPLSSLHARQDAPRPGGRSPAEPERTPLPDPLDLPRQREVSPRGAFARGVDETLQDDQMLLLGVDDLTSSRRSAAPAQASEAPAPKPLFHLEEEAPPPPAAPERAAPAGAQAPAQTPRPRRGTAPAGPSVQKLMDYIRLGGAVRCVDPWNRTCAAFMFRANGSAVFATDVFVNYLRAVFTRLKPEQPDDLSSGLQRDFVPQIRFLSSLVEALQTRRLLSVRAVKGLQLPGGQKLPSGFEFEASTRDMMHPLLLERLQALLQKPPMGFFLPDGPFSEVRGYLTDYQAFCRKNGEESRAAAMLIQIGLEEASPAPAAPPKSTPGGKTLEDVPPPPADTGVFMEESEELQDLNTFDFSPEDQKSILSQKEDAFSMSAFRRSAGQPMEAPGTGREDEGATPPPGRTANRAEDARKDDQIRNFLKDLGVEWKG